MHLRASELIHSRKDMLQYRVFIHVLEVDDYSPVDDSSDDDFPSQPDSGSGSSGGG
jgi:hypothetical protein